MPRIFWFRRDLRLQDNIALNQAIAGAKADGDSGVLATYAVDPDAFRSLAGIRQHSLIESLNSLSKDLNGALSVFQQPATVAMVEAAQRLNSKHVHATRAFDPAGVSEQNAVGKALQAVGVSLPLAHSYYAVAPSSVVKPDGTAYRVYTPFYNGWLKHGWAPPVSLESGAKWLTTAAEGIPVATEEAPFKVRAGEAFALRTFSRFRERALQNYGEDRNRPDLSGTSHLSHALAFGEIHPRTLLAELGDSDGEIVFRKELAWREFYADVLWQDPNSLDDYLIPKFAKMRYDSGQLANERFAAWTQGQTGYPIVDAGMRQLLQTGWMHNRVRMIVTSFLIKDLHLEWQLGARWFERNLSDYDPASNSHGWQWVAGSGTDASPYYRIFNPITQGEKFDPNGDYVRKFIPELRHVEGPAVHSPWLLIDGSSAGYPAPIVDHATERIEALARLEELKGQ